MSIPRVPGGFPFGRDIVDVWLGKATMHLISACGETPSDVGEHFERSLRFGHTHWDELSIPWEDEPGSLDTRPSAFLVRLDESLGSVLCSSLAVEAAANAFVHFADYPAELESISPLAKLSVATRLIGEVDPFSPGLRLHDRLTQLFALSDDFVRPWTQAHAEAAAETTIFHRINPLAANFALETAATAIATVDRLQEAPERRITAIALDVASALKRRAEVAAAASVPTQVELDEEHSRAASSFPPELVDTVNT